MSLKKTALALAGTILVFGIVGTSNAGPADIDRDADLPLEKPLLKKPPEKAPPPPPPPPVVTEPPPTIYGKDIESETSSIVYVLDKSGSMRWDIQIYVTPEGKTWSGNRLDRARAELVKSINSLPKNFKFNVYAYECFTTRWSSGLQTADDANKKNARAWIDRLYPDGGTATGPATAAALTENKENKLVVLLTDGAPTCGINYNPYLEVTPEELRTHREMIRNNNGQRATINVFGINATYQMRQFCLDVAADAGGTYTDVN